jgi:hypothetical protein
MIDEAGFRLKQGSRPYPAPDRAEDSRDQVEHITHHFKTAYLINPMSAG